MVRYINSIPKATAGNPIPTWTGGGDIRFYHRKVFDTIFSDGENWVLYYEYPDLSYTETELGSVGNQYTIADIQIPINEGDFVYIAYSAKHSFEDTDAYWQYYMYYDGNVYGGSNEVYTASSIGPYLSNNPSHSFPVTIHWGFIAQQDSPSFQLAIYDRGSYPPLVSGSSRNNDIENGHLFIQTYAAGYLRGIDQFYINET